MDAPILLHAITASSPFLTMAPAQSTINAVFVEGTTALAVDAPTQQHATFHPRPL
jgi:hypothetical protein